MAIDKGDDKLPGSATSQNASKIVRARKQGAEKQLPQAGEALEKRSAELARSLELMRTMLEVSSDGIMASDGDRLVTHCNQRYIDMWGLSDAIPCGLELRHPGESCVRLAREPNSYLARLDEIYSTAPAESIDALELADGRLFERISRTLFLDGRNAGRVWSYRDISERQQANKTELMMAAIVESSEDAIISKDLDGIIRSWNRGAQRVFGYTSGETIGKSITLIIPPELLEEEQKILRLLRRGERIEHFETIRVSKSGRRINISLTISPVRDSEGRIIGVSKIARDITELKRAQDVLAWDAQLLKNVRDAVIVTDLEGCVTHWNAGAERLFGWTAAEALRRHFPQLFSESVRSPIAEDILSQSLGREWSGEYEAWRKDGSRVWIDARIGPFADARGQLTGILALAHDITERRRAEEALRETDRRKDEFLALLAHELRNPLAPLRNGLQIMRLAAGDAHAIAQARAMMDRQLGHMVRLVDDLLDLSRIGQNKMELRRALIPLGDVIDNAVETARPAIDAGHHELAIAPPPPHALIDGDLTRLAQVFSNLLTNSAKYTEAGGHIRLTADLRGSEAIVAVADSGIGIPAESLSTVFDMFSQVDRSNERITGGLGIGLALVKGIVEMHGGSVSAESDGRGKGSRFTVRLPLATTIRDQPTETRIETGSVHAFGRRILVVDDNEDAARSMAGVLGLRGDEVQVIHDGLSAIDLAEKFQPHVILMDIGMPRMNGYEVSRRIRQNPWGRNAVIIAVTGWGHADDRAQSRQAGCDGHLVKPVDLAELEKLMDKLMLTRHWPGVP